MTFGSGKLDLTSTFLGPARIELYPGRQAGLPVARIRISSVHSAPVGLVFEHTPERGRLRKIAMSAFSGTFLNMALCDLGLDAFAICGIATEVGIEPTVRHGADLGYIPVVVADACGAGEEAAGRRSLESLAFAGDSFVTDVATIGPLLSW
jgi:nicotinamidase-related amidase